MGSAKATRTRSPRVLERLERAWEALPNRLAKPPSSLAHSAEYHPSSWPCGQQFRPESGSTPTRDQRDEATHYEGERDRLRGQFSGLRTTAAEANGSRACFDAAWPLGGLRRSRQPRAR